VTTPNPSTTEWVPLWDTGASGGPTGIGSIPGELKLWPSKTLPTATYGTWVWADGAAYDTATYPEASGNIDPAWKTFGGLADPGAGKFRVPDMRGVHPTGLDQMPGGTMGRANRCARATAITIAVLTGEEYHTLTVAETASHNHGGVTGNQSADHTHTFTTGTVSADHTHSGTTAGDSTDHVHSYGAAAPVPGFAGGAQYAVNAQQQTSGVNTFHTHTFSTGGISTNHTHSGTTAGVSANHTHTVSSQGGGGAHENLSPTVFVPYIVRLA